MVKKQEENQGIQLELPDYSQEYIQWLEKQKKEDIETVYIIELN